MKILPHLIGGVFCFMIIEYKGKNVQIDSDDLPLLNSKGWYWMNSNKKGLTEKWYLMTRVKDVVNGVSFCKTIYLHREIIKASKGEVCDHIDSNTLNNSRSNLRIVDSAENRRNSK